MLPELEKLLVIQDRDEKIHSIEKDITRIPLEEEKAKSRLAGDLSAVEAAKKAVQENEIAINNLQLEVETCQGTLGKLKTQQFETRKNEEFQALGHEIERYEKQIVELEDQELELMEKADSLKASLDEAGDKRDATQVLVDEELAKLEERRGICQGELDELRSERKQLASRVDPDTLLLYERMAKNKGTVIVRLDDHSGMCGGCHMKVTTATMHKARAEQEITHCEQCSRILYVIDADA
jgi:predicted  nucleic acid-binding Zn-ribbon protein